MKLYIGNATKQTHEFIYRVPGNPGVRVQLVPIGGQVQITGDLTTPEVDSIIAQHRKYGLTDINEIRRGFHGLCYSIDKPIPAAKLFDAIETGVEVLVERGRAIRKDLAVANNEILEQALREEGRPEHLKNFEMSVVEEERKDGTTSDSPIAEGVRVTSAEGQPRGRGRGRKA